MARMNWSAKAFDAPIDSELHAQLRDSLWIAGGFTEGPYLLGRLLSTNLFSLSTEDFLKTLQSYLLLKFSREVALMLTSTGGLGPCICVLRNHCLIFNDMQRIADRRENRAVAELAKNPRLTDIELAQILGTTPKTIARITYVSYFRILMARSDWRT